MLPEEVHLHTQKNKKAAHSVAFTIPLKMVLNTRALICVFQFLTVPHIVSIASCVTTQWRSVAVSNVLWELLFFRDTPLLVHDALMSVIEDPCCDPVLAAMAGVEDQIPKS